MADAAFEIRDVHASGAPTLSSTFVEDLCHYIYLYILSSCPDFSVLGNPNVLGSTEPGASRRGLV